MIAAGIAGLCFTFARAGIAKKVSKKINKDAEENQPSSETIEEVEGR